MISAFARLHLGSVVDDVNDELLDEWADLQRENNIQPGPISPFVEAELLKDTDLSLDGGEFEKRTGFVYEHPVLTLEEVRRVIESYLRMGWWPVEEPEGGGEGEC